MARAQASVGEVSRPYERREEFVPAITIDKDAEMKVRERWGHLFGVRQ